MTTTKSCAHCGKPITRPGKAGKAIYCSDACKMRAYRARRKAAQLRRLQGEEPQE